MKIEVGQHGYYSQKTIEVEFRCDPIPSTGRRFGYGRYFRHPHTTPERRIASAPENKLYTRGRRQVCHLPNTWDDIYTNFQRSWKKFRKTHYRKIVNM